MGPINAYKDMLDNMVSHIDRVVMNHQNQTRTNDIWGLQRGSWARGGPVTLQEVLHPRLN
jgi:hypothetical protein